MEDGNYIKIETGITADYNKVAEFPGPTCPSASIARPTPTTSYEMKTGSEGEARQ